MNLKYEVIPDEKIESCRDLCNELMAFQKSKAYITPELFETMNFDTRMIPSIQSALHNYTVVVKDDDRLWDMFIQISLPKKPIPMILPLFSTFLPFGKIM